MPCDAVTACPSRGFRWFWVGLAALASPGSRSASSFQPRTCASFPVLLRRRRGLRAAGKEREEREEREEQARALWPPPARRGKASGSHPRVWRSPEVLLQIQKTQGKDVPFYL